MSFFPLLPFSPPHTRMHTVLQQTEQRQEYPYVLLGLIKTAVPQTWHVFPNPALFIPVLVLLLATEIKTQTCPSLLIYLFARGGMGQSHLGTYFSRNTDPNTTEPTQHWSAPHTNEDVFKHNQKCHCHCPIHAKICETTVTELLYQYVLSLALSISLSINSCTKIGQNMAKIPSIHIKNFKQLAVEWLSQDWNR